MTDLSAVSTPPHARCNVLTDDGLVLVGARPESFTLESILGAGTALFVNLEQDEASQWYRDQLPAGVRYLHLPIKNGGVPTQTAAWSLVSEMEAAWRAKQRVYLHCHGGHGRSTVLGALFLGKVYGLDAAEAIQAMEARRLTRPDQSRAFIPIPETQAQVNFLVKMLPLKPGHSAPDRTDRSWLSRVRKERLERQRQQRQQRPAAATETTVSSAAPGSAAPTASTDAVRFYEKQGDYYELSNYYLGTFDYRGRTYASSEHAYQAAKFRYEGASPECMAYADLVGEAKTPNMSRVLAQQKVGGGYAWRIQLNKHIEQSLKAGVTFRPDWDAVKTEVMEEILMHKFSQNAHCRRILLSTGDRPLVENSPRDWFWGCGADQTGRNMLGKLLMKVRAQLREVA